MAAFVAAYTAPVLVVEGPPDTEDTITIDADRAASPARAAAEREEGRWWETKQRRTQPHTHTHTHTHTQQEHAPVVDVNVRVAQLPKPEPIDCQRLLLDLLL